MKKVWIVGGAVLETAVLACLFVALLVPRRAQVGLSGVIVGGMLYAALVSGVGHLTV